jgi:two-component system, OmpR family, alkaline phosphatase synthesis response regulator PhoP
MPIEKSKILVVDDERDIVDLVAHNLEREGFAVLRAYDGEEAMELIEREKPRLAILDIMLPGMNGLDLCRILRRKTRTEALPIIMLTAKGDELDKVLGLESGADDYVTKPFRVRELVARVRAVLRRSESASRAVDEEIIQQGGLRIDCRSYEVTVDGRKCILGATEFKLLRFLASHPGRVYTRDQLLDHVWQGEAFVEPRTVDVHVSRLRGAIETEGERQKYIQTVRGIGYKFAEAK